MGAASNRLHIGSGTHYAADWCNVDVDPFHQVDILADAQNLPFEDNRFTQIYMGHFLEHLPWDLIPAILAELRRVAAPGCEVAVVGPAMDLALAQGYAGSWLEHAIEAHDPPPAGHAWTATTELTRQACELGGLVVEEVPVSTVRPPKWCNVAPDAEWQCAFIGGWPDAD